MNFSSILAQIEELDPEVYERLSPRRAVIRNWTRRVSLAAVPLALGSLFNKAYGQTQTDTIVNVLNFALKLEYLESEFYRKGLEASLPPNVSNPLIPSVTGLEQPAFALIYKHEQTHVKFLQDTITAMGKKYIDMPKFDFSGGSGTGGGPFANVFKDYDMFLAVAQTFEDTGVRAYKGQATTLKPDKTVLSAALRIHATEARHAAHIRLMRSQTAGPLSDNQDIRPWITLKESGINSPDVQASYNGEDNTSQAATEITLINGFLQITSKKASEAFDEPLTMKDINDIVVKFLA